MAILIIPLIFGIMFVFYYLLAKAFGTPKKANDPIASALRREKYRDWERYNKLVMRKSNGKLRPEEQIELNRLIFKRSGDRPLTQSEQYEEWLDDDNQKEQDWFDSLNQ